MYEDTMVLIPARSGSRRLIGKNELILQGQPLVSYTIQVALSRFRVDQIRLSTDGEKVAQIGVDHGLDPYPLRQRRLASDAATTFELIQGEMSQFHWSENYKWILVLPPTSPLRLASDLDRILEVRVNGCEAVSVCSSEATPRNMYELLGSKVDGAVDLSTADPAGRLGRNKQEWPKWIRRNGSMYLLSLERLISDTALLPENLVGILQPPERSFDIDGHFDFTIVDSYMTKMKIAGPEWQTKLAAVKHQNLSDDYL